MGADIVLRGVAYFDSAHAPHAATDLATHLSPWAFNASVPMPRMWIMHRYMQWHEIIEVWPEPPAQGSRRPRPLYFTGRIMQNVCDTGDAHWWLRVDGSPRLMPLAKVIQRACKPEPPADEYPPVVTLLGTWTLL